MNDDNATPGTAIARTEEVYVERRMTKIDEWEDTQRSIRTSIDISTDEGKSQYLACLNGKDASLQDEAGRLVVVVNWLVHLVDRLDEKTGEIVTGLRLALVLQDGRIIAGASGPMIDAWAHIVRMYRDEPKWPTLEIAIKANPVAGGKGKYLTIPTVRKLQQPKLTTAKSSK